MADDLTPKQECFCQEYIIDLNGAAAAVRAGYSENTARSIASENLTKPNVRRRVVELKAELAKRLEITAESVIVDLDILCMNAVEAGQFGPAIRAKELQGKHLGLFIDKSGEAKPAPETDWNAIADTFSGGDPVVRAKIWENLPIPFSVRERLNAKRAQANEPDPDTQDDTGQQQLH